MLFHLHEKQPFEAHGISWVTGYASSPSPGPFIRITVPCQVRAGPPPTKPCPQPRGFSVREDDTAAGINRTLQGPDRAAALRAGGVWSGKHGRPGGARARLTAAAPAARSLLPPERPRKAHLPGRGENPAVKSAGHSVGSTETQTESRVTANAGADQADSPATRFSPSALRSFLSPRAPPGDPACCPARPAARLARATRTQGAGSVPPQALGGAPAGGRAVSASVGP